MTEYKADLPARKRDVSPEMKPGQSRKVDPEEAIQELREHNQPLPYYDPEEESKKKRELVS